MSKKEVKYIVIPEKGREEVVKNVLDRMLYVKVDESRRVISNS